MTTLPSTDGILAQIDQISAHVNALYDQANQARKASLPQVLDLLAKSGAVSFIAIRGYTPSFNDGEPCTHSYDFWVNIQQLAEDDSIYDTFRDEDDEDNALSFIDDLEEDSTYDRTTRSHHQNLHALARNRALCAEHGHVYEPPSQDLINAIGITIVEAIDKERGTDYWTSFTFRDGAVIRRDGDYDAGY